MVTWSFFFAVSFFTTNQPLFCTKVSDRDKNSKQPETKGSTISAGWIWWPMTLYIKKITCSTESIALEKMEWRLQNNYILDSLPMIWTLEGCKQETKQYNSWSWNAYTLIFTNVINE